MAIAKFGPGSGKWIVLIIPSWVQSLDIGSKYIYLDGLLAEYFFQICGSVHFQYPGANKFLIKAYVSNRLIWNDLLKN